MKPVKIYSKQPCPYCVKAKAFFDSKSINYEEIDLTHDHDALARLVEKTNMRTVPQIFIDDQLIGGCDDLLRLDEEGKLAELLA